ncbi:unnamed protein product [Oikopleura dioica]|uniref:Uncharacterized protein n=1 Tax=Oikopleura dioica TaxID=34765 RepID=E4XKF9_OIKDI|nr:unnamed protein product [Oikopleura dioica]
MRALSGIFFTVCLAVALAASAEIAEREHFPNVPQHVQKRAASEVSEFFRNAIDADFNHFDPG